ncbi:MAG: hypothetical protein HY978_00785 [Candidatus Liptonbacteria bacterium]|nr:hypothetical protein [Candidatus Liptonbacteria bacterium]
MTLKLSEQNSAISLRRKGLSYREILTRVPVAKSTLSLWLQSVKLATHQVQRLSEKKRLAAMRGAATRHNKRIAEIEKLKISGQKEVGKVSKRELMIIGTVLYWAEGSKEKDERPGSSAKFTNSDPRMVRLYLKWLKDVCGVPEESITCSIIIHENHKYRLGEVIKYWAECTGFSTAGFTQIYFKRHKPKTNRKNIGLKYFGILSVKVNGSSHLLCKIQGWIHGITQCTI